MWYVWDIFFGVEWRLSIGWSFVMICQSNKQRMRYDLIDDVIVRKRATWINFEWNCNTCQEGSKISILINFCSVPNSLVNIVNLTGCIEKEHLMSLCYYTSRSSFAPLFFSIFHIKLILSTISATPLTRFGCSKCNVHILILPFMIDFIFVYKGLNIVGVTFLELSTERLKSFCCSNRSLTKTFFIHFTRAFPIKMSNIDST